MANLSDQYFNITPSICSFLDHLKSNQPEVLKWMEQKETVDSPLLYSSVDIRDSGFKVAIVDTNIFPGGFNNLCEHGLEDAVGFVKSAVLKRVANCRRILIVAEEHSRNVWYLENIRILQEIVAKAGFDVKIATFMTVQPAFCESATRYVELETATKASVKIYCFKRILADIETGSDQYDLIVLNNDLTGGIPDVLRKTKVPIYPSMLAGWHSRLKSLHFKYANELLSEFATILKLDPWLFSCYFTGIDNASINNDADRQRMADAASDLFKKITAKYKEHNILDKPYLVLKSDAGTYGMGVVPVESPDDILALNRRARNDLSKGKNAQVTTKFLLQEGVSTIHSIDEHVCEVVMYQIENNMIGGFYRYNTEKGNRENLNSPGMGFKKMCPHLKKYGECKLHPDLTVFDIYRLLGRVASIAARKEIAALESLELAK